MLRRSRGFSRFLAFSTRPAKDSTPVSKCPVLSTAHGASCSSSPSSGTGTDRRPRRDLPKRLHRLAEFAGQQLGHRTAAHAALAAAHAGARDHADRIQRLRALCGNTANLTHGDLLTATQHGVVGQQVAEVRGGGEEVEQNRRKAPLPGQLAAHSGNPVGRDAASQLCGCGQRGQPALPLRHILAADARTIAYHEQSWQRGLEPLVAHGQVGSVVGVVAVLAAGLACELDGRCEAVAQADRIDGDGFVTASVYGANDCPLDLPFTLGTAHHVSPAERRASRPYCPPGGPALAQTLPLTPDREGMPPAAPGERTGVQHGCDFASGIQEMARQHQLQRPSAAQQEAPAGQQPLVLHQGQGGSRRDHTRQGPAREGYRPVVCTRRQDDLPGQQPPWGAGRPIEA